jgi:organic radical activating enzyme
VKIAEIFLSAQGEGARMGEPAVFVRLAGCSLRCEFCDTPRAISGGREMTVAGIMREVSRLAPFPGIQVVITGGEPLEQDLAQLVIELSRSRFFLSVETNGLHYQDLAIHWWAVAPKPAAGYRTDPRIRCLAHEVKLVVVPELTVDVVKTLRRQMPRAIFYLQPNAREKNGCRTTGEFFRQCVSDGIRGLRLGLQLHRIYRIP